MILCRKRIFWEWWIWSTAKESASCSIKKMEESISSISSATIAIFCSPPTASNSRMIGSISSIPASKLTQLLQGPSQRSKRGISRSSERPERFDWEKATTQKIFQERLTSEMNYSRFVLELEKEMVCAWKWLADLLQKGRGETFPLITSIWPISFISFLFSPTQEKKVLGRFSLGTCMGIQLADEEKIKRSFGFEILTPDRTYLVCAVNENDVRWLMSSVTRMKEPFY